MLQPIFHSQLRTSLPRSLRRQLNSTLFTRLQATRQSPRTLNNRSQWPDPKGTIPVVPRKNPPAVQHAKGATRQRAPERIIIYHGGTGRTLFIGLMRVTTIFLFGISAFIIAPSLVGDDQLWYIAPAVAIGSALPFIVVSYTAAPFVNFIHLELPVWARRTTAEAIQYAKKLPPTAKLYINTTGPTLVPRQTELRFGHLVPDRALLRPVSFRNKDPIPLPWWQGKTLQQFYTADKMKSGMQSKTFYPGLWEHVYKQIQNQRPSRRNQS